jgi:hypothetical protein
MNVTRPIFAFVVGVAVAAGAFDHLLGIGSGPGGILPAAFANEGGSGGGGERRVRIFLKTDEPSPPEPSGPAAQPAPAKSLEQTLARLQVHIHNAESEFVQISEEIATLEAKIKRPTTSGAQKREWERELNDRKQLREIVSARLRDLETRKTALVVAWLLGNPPGPPP